MHIWPPLFAALPAFTTTYTPSELPSPTPSQQTPSTPTPLSSPPPDPALWRPISTYLLPLTTPISPLPSPTITTPSTNTHAHDIEFRQVTGQAVPGTLDGADQISPVTTYQVYSTIDGAVQQVNVIYTQLFIPVPDQWPSASVGSIGLGPIAAKKTKRDLEPAETAAVKRVVERRGVEFVA